MRLLSVTILLITCCNVCTGQHRDTLRKYLDDNLSFTSKNKAVYNALAIQSGDHWLLFSVYADTGVLLRAYFKDRSLRIKDGPFTLYHQNNIKAMEGYYLDNVQQGIKRYWYPNGQLKDSGMVKNNFMVNSWYSWKENGQLTTIAGYLPPDSIPDKIVVYANSSQNKPGLFDKDTLVSYLHGTWISYYGNGNMKDSGVYVSGLREREWVTWYSSGSMSSKGAYKNDKQDGEWFYYYENGHASTREQYKNNKVVALECFDEQGNAAGNFCPILKPPFAILERFANFNDYMLDHIFWPKELDGQNVNGIVTGKYTITKEGKLIDFNILETPHELLGKETERFFKSIEKWSPAVSHNRVIEYTVNFEIPFLR